MNKLNEHAIISLGDYMKRMISLILSITLIVVLVSCAKGEKATLKEVLKLYSATPVSELNEFDELMISIDNRRYRINNANDFVSGFCDELDRYRLEEIEIENYNIDVQDYYFSLDKESGWNSGVAFCINQDDEIQVRYNFTKSKYYKCKGVFDEITSFLASELEYQDKHYSIKSTEDYLEEYFSLGYECYFINNDKILSLDKKIDILISLFKDIILFFNIDFGLKDYCH